MNPNNLWLILLNPAMWLWLITGGIPAYYLFTGAETANLVVADAWFTGWVLATVSITVGSFLHRAIRRSASRKD